MQPFIRANDATEYVAVIAADDQAAANVELVDLQMCCKKAKESHIDTSLIFSLAKSEQHLLRLEGRRRVLREARPAALFPRLQARHVRRRARRRHGLYKRALSSTRWGRPRCQGPKTSTSS